MEQKLLGSKLSAWVMANTAENQEAEFLVILADKSDSKDESGVQGKAEKNVSLAATLSEKARIAQGSLLGWLRANGIRHQPFYIVNAVLVRGTREVAEAIAARPDVVRIDANPAVRNRPLVQPAAEDIARLAQRLTVPEAVELGVTAIRAPEVWGLGVSPTFKGEGIVIGSVDSGVQWDHPALKDRYRGWNGTTADHNYNWHDSIHSGGSPGCEPNSTAPCDDHSHGTHTMGTAVGDDGAGNQIGVAPKAKFITCRAMDQLVGTPASYLECMQWMLAPKKIDDTMPDESKAPDIVLANWTCPASEGCPSATLQNAVSALRNAGIMVVTLSGSDGPTCSTIQDAPAIYDEVYTAGAFDANSPTKEIASFSSRGPVTIDGRVKPDITAPGVFVRSAVRGTDNTAYEIFSGTSMAAAHTAGAVALLWAARPAYRRLVASTEAIFSDSASHVTDGGCGSTGIPNNVYGYGRLDVKAAVDLAATQGAPLQFYPLSHPVRLLDTRAGQAACYTPGAPIAGGTSPSQPARGECGGLTIPSNAAAITGNITTVNSDGGYLTLYPSNAAQPVVANTNYAPNEIINNVFTVGLGNDGAFKIFALNSTDVVVDVTGYYAPPGAGGLYFHPLPKPIRLLETRAGLGGCNTPGAPLPGNADTMLGARLTCDGVTIPPAAAAIVGNATTVEPGGTGGQFLTLFPADATRPLVASSNYLSGQVMNAPFTVGLSSAGAFKIYPTTQTHLIVDVLGYYSTEASDVNGTGLLFYPLPKPVRLLETRPGLSGCSAPGEALAAGSTRTQFARGSCGGEMVANMALAIVGNATVVPTNGGFLTFWPSGATRPLVATSNFGNGQVLNRHFTVGLGSSDGAFNIYTQLQTHLIVDVSGYFAP